MAFHTIKNCKLRRPNAIKGFEVFQRHLEEGELVALEILCQRETEHGFRSDTQCCQYFDPEIDIAVGFRPDTRLGMQSVRRITVGRDVRKNCLHGRNQPHSSLRTFSGQISTSRP